MYMLHEIVKVYPRFAFNRSGQSVVKKVHQHRLAAADVAKEVQSAGKVVWYLPDGSLSLFRSASE